MSHIFYIHSWICYLVAEKVIQHEKIQTENVTFLFVRGFNAGRDCIYKHIIFPFDMPYEYFHPTKNFFKGRFRLWKLDKFIDNITAGYYVAYWPHELFTYGKLVNSSKKCKGYYLIEEGLGSYNKQNAECADSQESFVFNMYLKASFGSRLASEASQKKYLGAYGLSEAVFPGRSNVKSLRQYLVTDTYSREYDQYQNSIIIVFDAVVEAKMIPLNIVLDVFKKLLDSIRFRNKKIYIKFHPASYLDNIFVTAVTAIIDYEYTTLGVSTIDPTISLELLAGHVEAEFYVNVSSVGLYANLQGRVVYSFAKLLASEYPLFRKKIDVLPDIFHDSVKFLNDFKSPALI